MKRQEEALSKQRAKDSTVVAEGSKNWRATKGSATGASATPAAKEENDEGGRWKSEAAPPARRDEERGETNWRAKPAPSAAASASTASASASASSAAPPTERSIGGLRDRDRDEPRGSDRFERSTRPSMGSGRDGRDSGRDDRGEDRFGGRDNRSDRPERLNFSSSSGSSANKSRSDFDDRPSSRGKPSAFSTDRKSGADSVSTMGFKGGV